MSLDELKCDYTIKPISGMEAVQKNFVELSSNGDRAAYNLLQGKLNLAKRFRLIERGFVLVQKEKKSNAFEDVSTYMVFNPKNKENEDIAAKDVDK